MNGPYLRKLMLERGLDAKAFAKHLNVSTATVYNMIGGKTVSLRVAYRASKKLKIPLEKLAPDLVRRYDLPKSAALSFSKPA